MICVPSRRHTHVRDANVQVRRDPIPPAVGKIEQDYLRRTVLHEHGSDDAPRVAPAFITSMVRAALDAGYHVVLEGILHTGQYRPVLRELIAGHPGPAHVFWLQVSFAETLRRHAGRPDLAHVTAERMRSWYTALDLLSVPGEQVIEEPSGLEDTVARILHVGGLAGTAALSPCPAVCPRCLQLRRAGAAAPGRA